jgi:hypothetical protein
MNVRTSFKVWVSVGFSRKFLTHSVSYGENQTHSYICNDQELS